MKRALVLTSLLPLLLALAFVRPVSAAGDPVYDSVSMTAISSAGRTNGVVGASGGLVTLDTGSAYVSASLDSAPSASVIAAPQEPGTLFHTAAGQVNGGAGQTVVGTLEAEARYPGTPSSGSFNVGDPVDNPPVYLGAANASAKVTPTTTTGTAQAARYRIAPVFDIGPGTSTVSQALDLEKGTAKQTAKVTVSDIDLAGVLQIQSIVATAEITADGDTHTPKQSLVVSGATVGGQQVAITNDGVVAVGTPVLPATTLQQATDTVNTTLAAAGVSTHTLGGTTKKTDRSAEADTGGVAMTLTSPDLPAGISGNTLLVVLGGIQLTELDSRALPAVVVPPITVQPPVVTQPGTTTTTVIPGTPGIPGTISPPGEQPPAIAPGESVAFEVRGRRISPETALVAFAGWQLLSLGTATLYGFVERRRRLALLGREP